MPSIAQEYRDPICKKRRREDGDMQMKLSSPRSPHHHREHSTKESPIPSRRFIGLKSSKRQRFETALPPPPTHLLLHTPPYQQDHGRDSFFAVSTQEEKPKEKKKDLSPCHICHRRPTVMQELDNFADCEGCGERTCWICVRECAGFNRREVEGLTPLGEDGVHVEGDVGPKWGMGWKRLGELNGDGDGDGHRRMVCSRCCVEKGTEGEVWCLGCLRSECDG